MSSKVTTADLAEKYPASVMRMEDWSGGQFYILETQYLPENAYLQQLLDDAVDALTNHSGKLSDWGRSVAERLMQEIPLVMRPEKPLSLQPTITAKSGFVYLVQSPTGAYKIGRTVDPDNRMRTFLIKLPFEVEYVCVIPTSDMRGLESELHAKFASKRLRGEWFALAAEDIEYIKGLAR